MRYSGDSSNPEPPVHLTSNLREAVAWRIIAESMRRHGARYQVARLHPGGGQYDCLSLIEQGETRLMLNVEGSLQVTSSDGRSGGIGSAELWPAAVTSEGEGRGLANVLDRVSALLEEPVPSPLPATTRPVLASRVMASASLMVSLEQSNWRWANGYLDTSGYGGGIKQAWFDLFPAARDALEQEVTGPRELEAAYRYWFWTRDGTPQICVSSTAMAYGPDGWQRDLMSVYGKRRRLADVVYRGLEPVLG